MDPCIFYHLSLSVSFYEPMPDYIIQLLNALAAKSKIRVPPNPEFRRGNTIIIGDPIPEPDQVQDDPNLLLPPTMDANQQRVATEDPLPLEMDLHPPPTVVVHPDELLDSDLQVAPPPAHRGGLGQPPPPVPPDIDIINPQADDARVRDIQQEAEHEVPPQEATGEITEVTPDPDDDNRDPEHEIPELEDDSDDEDDDDDEPVSPPEQQHVSDNVETMRTNSNYNLRPRAGR